jgi:hypothetical protein
LTQRAPPGAQRAHQNLKRGKHIGPLPRQPLRLDQLAPRAPAMVHEHCAGGVQLGQLPPVRLQLAVALERGRGLRGGKLLRDL